MHIDGESLPPLYAKWVADFVGGVIPRESRATCNACVMCAEARPDTAPRAYFFDIGVKCCSYIPTLPNFLVGRILVDSDPTAQVGRRTVDKRIEGAVGVTPLGLVQSPVFHMLYHNSSNSFGRSKTLRCPHYIEEGGHCGIWRNRNSVCTTWFCKHVRGQVGHVFWRSLERALGLIEKELAQWCVLELQPDANVLRCIPDWLDDVITGDTLDNKVDEKAYQRMWDTWFGREREFFQRCAELVSPLSWADVVAVCGTEVRKHIRLTQESYGRLTSENMPNALNVGPINLVQMERGSTRVRSYSDYDPLDIPNVVMELLQYFDGRPTEQSLAAIAKERGIRVDPALVQKLVDFKVLVPPGDAVD